MRSLLASALVFVFLPSHGLAASPSLTVTQSPIAAGSVPKGAQRVPFLSLAFSASCASDATVSEITLGHAGLGSSVDLSRAYALDAKGRRITRARPIDAEDRSVTLRFAPPLSIDACATVAVTVAADVSPDAAPSGEHLLSLSSASDVSADVPVSVRSPEPAPTAVVRPRSVGTVSVTVEGPRAAQLYGANRILARVRLEADGERDQDISSITLTNSGKATDGDLQNLRLTRRGVAVTSVAATMDGDLVTLTFEPALRLGRNDEVLLELKGDIRASKRRTVRFVLEEPSDLSAAPAASNRSR